MQSKTYRSKCSTFHNSLYLHVISLSCKKLEDKKKTISKLSRVAVATVAVAAVLALNYSESIIASLLLAIHAPPRFIPLHLQLDSYLHSSHPLRSLFAPVLMYALCINNTRRFNDDYAATATKRTTLALATSRRRCSRTSNANKEVCARPQPELKLVRSARMELGTSETTEQGAPTRRSPIKNLVSRILHVRVCVSLCILHSISLSQRHRRSPCPA